MFNGFTKIADVLRLSPDDFAPLLHFPSPPPGERAG